MSGNAAGCHRAYCDSLQTRGEFSSNGNGHGVGMSQVGAAGYIAKEGWNYKKILEHYFPNAKVQ